MMCVVGCVCSMLPQETDNFLQTVRVCDGDYSGMGFCQDVYGGQTKRLVCMQI